MEAWRSWPAIDSHDALRKVLEERLGYCTCAYDTALPLLRDFLRLVVERTDWVQDTHRHARACRELVELLRAAGSPAIQSWFVYALDRADLISHGFNLYDVWVMDRGRWVLDGLERFPEPPPPDSAEAEPGAAADRGLSSGS